MPAPRHIRTLLVALLVAALGLGVAAPVQAKDASARKAEHEARKALEADRKAAGKARKHPAIVVAKGMVLAPPAVSEKKFQMEVVQSNVAGLRGTKDVVVTLHGKAVTTLANKPVDLANIQPGDRVQVRGLQTGEKALTGYLVRFDRTDPRPVRLQGKVTKTDPLTLFARGMDTPITFATSSIQVRNGKPVGDTNKVAVGDQCHAVGFPEGQTLRAFYLNCRSMPPQKGKPEHAPQKGKPAESPATAKK